MKPIKIIAPSLAVRPIPNSSTAAAGTDTANGTSASGYIVLAKSIHRTAINCVDGAVVKTVSRCCKIPSIFFKYGTTLCVAEVSFSLDISIDLILLGTQMRWAEISIWTLTNKMIVPVTIDMPGMAPVGAIAMRAGTTSSGPWADVPMISRIFSIETRVPSDSSAIVVSNVDRPIGCSSEVVGIVKAIPSTHTENAEVLWHGFVIRKTKRHRSSAALKSTFKLNGKSSVRNRWHALLGTLQTDIEFPKFAMERKIKSGAAYVT